MSDREYRLENECRKKLAEERQKLLILFENDKVRVSQTPDGQIIYVQKLSDDAHT